MMTLYRKGSARPKEVRRVKVAMHINHRRKNKFRGKHHGIRHGGFLAIYSMKPMRQEFWRQARARAQDLMRHGRYDLLPTRYPDSILWDYW
jgi:hypothetical protein